MNLRLRHHIRCVASSDAPEGADGRTQSVLSPTQSLRLPLPFIFIKIKEGSKGVRVPFIKEGGHRGLSEAERSSPLKLKSFFENYLYAYIYII